MEALRVQWPTWLENLLSVVHYNFAGGIVLFCITCSKTVSQEEHSDAYHWLQNKDCGSSIYHEVDFEEGVRHYRHDRLQVYNYENIGLCVNRADIESFGVSTEEIQDFQWAVPPTNSQHYVFLNNISGYEYDNVLITATLHMRKCIYCDTRLQYRVRELNSATPFCCLECKFLFVNEQKAAWPELGSTSARTPSLPNLNLPRGLRQSTYAQAAQNDSVPKRARQPSGGRTRNVACPPEQNCYHFASELWHESDVNVSDKAEDDASSMLLDANYAEELQQVYDLHEALYEYQLASLSIRNESEPIWMPQLCRFLPCSKDNIRSLCRSDSDSKVERVSTAQFPKCSLAHALHRAPAAVLETRVPTNGEQGTHVVRIQHSKHIECRDVVGYPEFEHLCCTGSNFSSESTALTLDRMRSAGNASVQEHVQNEDDLDQIGHPEAQDKGSSSSGVTGTEFPYAFPGTVESLKIKGDLIDVTSLKQLLTTFDPKSWTSNSRRSDQVPKLLTACATIL